MDKKTGYILYLDLLGYKNIIRSKDDVQEAELSKFVEEFISVEKLKTEVKKCHKHFEEDKLSATANLTTRIGEFDQL